VSRRPQTFPVASRTCSNILPGSSRRNSPRRDAPRPARIRQVRAGVKIKDVKRRFLAYSFPPRSPDPPHLAVLDVRLCRGCSRPPRHHPDQAAPSFTALLRQDGGEGLSPPLE
jgi:hypothetical protein